MNYTASGTIRRVTWRILRIRGTRSWRCKPALNLLQEVGRTLVTGITTTVHTTSVCQHRVPTVTVYGHSFRHSKTAATQSLLVSWCFKSSQPQRITSGLRETFIKRYIVERINKAELRPEEQSERTGSCGLKHHWKGHKDRNRHKNRIRRSGQGRLVYVFDI